MANQTVAATQKPFLRAIGFTKATGLYEVLFPFFLIWALFFAILSKTKMFSESKDINGLISFFVASLVVVFPGVREYITTMLPYVTGYIIVLFLLVMVFLVAGASPEDIAKGIRDRRAYLIILGLLILLFIIPITQVLGPQVAPPAVREDGGNATGGGATEPGELSNWAVYVLSSPPVVGMMVLTVVFTITIYTLLQED